MKRFLTLFNVFFLSALSYGYPQINQSRIKEAVKSGEWSDPAVWSNEIIPNSGDCIIIPKEYSVIIKEKIDYGGKASGPNEIYLHGKLLFDINGKLYLPSGSTIHVEQSGAIENQSPANSGDRIRIGNSIYFTTDDAPIKGPYIVKKSNSPASFINFNVALQHKKALIQWTTSNELINANFELQRNIDMDNWVTVATIQSEPIGNNLRTYKFIDKDKNSVIANYRLKIVDNSGAVAYSPVRSAKYTELGPEVSIGACTSGNIVLHFSQEISSTLIFRLENLNGDVVESKKIKIPVGDIDIKIKDVAPGNYMATVSGPMGFRYVQPVKF